MKIQVNKQLGITDVTVNLNVQQLQQIADWAKTMYDSYMPSKEEDEREAKKRGKLSDERAKYFREKAMRNKLTDILRDNDKLDTFMKNMEETVMFLGAITQDVQPTQAVKDSLHRAEITDNVAQPLDY